MNWVIKRLGFGLIAKGIRKGFLGRLAILAIGGGFLGGVVVSSGWAEQITQDPAPVLGAVYTVDRLDDELTATGCLDGVPDDCSLRGAIRAANMDSMSSTVLLPAGTYNLTREGADEDFATTGDLDIWEVGRDFTLESMPGAHPVIRQFEQDRIFHVGPSVEAVIFQGPMTLLDGEADFSSTSHGGSLYFFRALSLTLNEVHFLGGYSRDHGGCLDWAEPIDTGFLQINGGSFKDCESGEDGGAFFIQFDDSPVTLDGVLVENNSAVVTGGGGVLVGGSAHGTIQHSLFRDNSVVTTDAQSWGGGIVFQNGSYSLLHSTITENSADALHAGKGAGLFVENSLLLIRNSTLSRNRSLGASTLVGTELETLNSTVGLESVTLKAEDSSHPFAVMSTGSGSSIDFLASIVEGACSLTGGALTSSGSNVERSLVGASTTSCNLVHPADVFTIDPFLKPLAGYGGPTPTHALLAGSPTLIVPSTDCPVEDQRLAPREFLFCDAGAYESSGNAPGDWIFADGFESGDPTAWSAVSP